MPETIGVAKLVALFLAVPPPGTAPRMSVPGASTPCVRYGRPQLLMSIGAPFASIAPTESTELAAAGT